jgi:hypothetical protein
MSRTDCPMSHPSSLRRQSGTCTSWRAEGSSKAIALPSERTLLVLSNSRVTGRRPRGATRNPQSAFYRALHVSYLSRSDIERASPLSKRPGRDIVIHGLRNGFGWIGRLHLLSTEPHIDYSHRGVGPYGPEADSQVPPSDNGLYHLTSI